MASRLELQELLETLLGSRRVYYQAPENNKMEYPCIRYSKSIPDVKYADNAKYINRNCYEIIVIDRKPDNEVIEKITNLPFSRFDNHYVSDNLHHDVISLYF